MAYNEPSGVVGRCTQFTAPLPWGVLIVHAYQREFIGMQVLPVLDLLHGVVVHAVAGERAQYRPLAQSWIGSSDPLQVAQALQAEYGLSEFYVADLDGILHQRVQWQVLAQLQAAGFRLWVDVGWRTVHEVRAGGKFALHRDPGPREASRSGDQAEQARPWRWVLGSESVESRDELAGIVGELGAESCTFSLDLRDEQLQLGAGWGPTAPAVLDCASLAAECGLSRFLVLELTRVGTARGLAPLDLVSQLRQRAGVAEVWWGGGVQTAEDLARLAELGVARVLVGTALFARRLTPREVQGCDGTGPN